MTSAIPLREPSTALPDEQVATMLRLLSLHIPEQTDAYLQDMARIAINTRAIVEATATMRVQLAQLNQQLPAPVTVVVPKNPSSKVPLIEKEWGMVPIPADSFMMGGLSFKDERPRHCVHVSAFALGKHPVTQAQWTKVMGRNPSGFKHNAASCPVENVSWDDVQEFLTRLNGQTDGCFRLPSEAEWEYAARARSEEVYCFGNDSLKLPQFAWYDENSGKTTHPVGEKAANAFGLYDMHGNVWEWVQDAWHDNYVDAPTDGSVWLTGASDSRKMMRGGSCFDSGMFLRSSYRSGNAASHKSSNIGFRLARTIS